MSSLEVLVEPEGPPNIIAVKIWINAGSSSDPIGQRGAHQLLGSLLTRGCGPYDHLEVANLVENSGAELRCDTVEDGLLISLKCTNDDSDKLIPLLGWMLSDPHLEDNQIELEKSLTLQALRRQKENPFSQAFDGWRKLAYGDGPYGHDPLGTTEDLGNIYHQQLEIISNKLTQRSKVIVLAGEFDHDIDKEILKMESFSSLIVNTKKTYKSKEYKPSPDNLLRSSTQNIHLQSEDTGQVIIMLGQPTIPYWHSDHLKLKLLSCYLGIGMSSYLFKKLREENGVAYEVGVHHPARRESAPFLIHASTSEEKSLVTLRILIETWRKINQEELSKEELSLSKAKFLGQLAHESQTIAQKAEKIAILRGFNLPKNHDDLNRINLENITESDLREAAKNHLSNPMLSLCGPEKTINQLSLHWKEETNNTLRK